MKSLGVPVHQNFIWLPARPEIKANVEKIAGADSRWIVINPGARWLNKRWPAEYFAALVKRLAAQNPNHRFVILGGKDDQPLGKIIAQAEPERCLDLTGKTSLLEMIEWIRLGEFIVTNDTGPMHIAAALGKPVVADVRPHRSAPHRSVWPDRKCFAHPPAL